MDVRPLVFAAVVVGMLDAGASAQQPGSPGLLADKGRALLQQASYLEAEEVFLRWVGLDEQDPDAHFHLALSRALQGKLDLALGGFHRTLALNPGRADACFEIAGIHLIRKTLNESLGWVDRGLRLEPDSPYGLDLAGTVHFLLGSKIEALRYWNRLDRPRLSKLEILSTSSIDRQRVADEIALRPGSLLSYSELDRARWRLQQHAYIRAVTFEPVPEGQADQYALLVNVDSRKGLGTPIELATNSLAGVGFRTLRFTYWNVGGTGTTVETAGRFKSGAQLAYVSVRAPRPAHLPVYTDVSYTWRNERWAFAGGGDPGADDQRLTMHEVSAFVLIPVREPTLTVRTGLLGRWRGLPADFNPATRERWRRAMWLRVAPRLRVFDRRILAGWSWESHLQAGLDAGRYVDHPGRTLGRIAVSWESRADRVSRGDLQSTLQWALHSGWLPSSAALEDHFLMGVGPGARFQLRAHPLFQDNAMGSTPLAGQFVLGNFAIAQDLHVWKWLRLGVVAFCDLAQIPRTYPAQHVPSTALDTGVGIELGTAGQWMPRFTVAYGHDWRGDGSVFYFSTGFR